MSKLGTVDPLPHLHRVAAATAARGQPGAAFAALDSAMAAVFGHRLFTILQFDPEKGESARRYSSNETAYPVGGRKPLNPTFWSQQVLVEHRPWIGYDAADIRSVFYDHELIASLGCDAMLNLPVVHDGRALGTINISNAAGWYDETDIPVGLVFAALAIPAYLSLGR
jgi:hypothetical protein